MMNIAHWLDAIYNLTQASKDFRKNVKFIHDYNRRGFETTASSITFTLFLLGNHPEVQAKVQEEIDELFADDTDRDVTIEDTKKMQYLECVVKASMEARNTCALKIDICILIRVFTVGSFPPVGEYTIPKGSAAVAGIYFIQRHPRFFDEPDKFMPERFLDTKEKCPFLYIPFSAGLRNCTGQKFADLEDKILLAQIMRRFTVTSKLRMEELQLSLEVVLKATQGIEIQLHPRDKPPRPQ
ncbi:hypothetical protein HPB48_004583 [Haemaphysalis longicornis]|uniref:Cytochrome P450 n=1 Tax=Haemaphysalis longicornis TaxID=44386 RepID=A0A9J6FEL1_HAELO|nr:hypothetical protein HPB48_004583 [Haemaphysalis longicornis]